MFLRDHIRLCYCKGLDIQLGSLIFLENIRISSSLLLYINILTSQPLEFLRLADYSRREHHLQGAVISDGEVLPTLTTTERLQLSLYLGTEDVLQAAAGLVGPVHVSSEVLPISISEADCTVSLLHHLHTELAEHFRGDCGG